MGLIPALVLAGAEVVGFEGFGDLEGELDRLEYPC